MVKLKQHDWRKALFYEVNWSWDKNIERFIKKLCIGRTLNIPCGKSRIGDLRIDIDKSVNPDAIGDLEYLNIKELKGKFETLLCDPPYSMYSKRKWLYKLTDIPTKRIIFSTPLIAIKLPRRLWKKDYYILENNSPYFIRLIQVFDKINKQLF